MALLHVKIAQRKDLVLGKHAYVSGERHALT